MVPHWLHILSLGAIALGFACAAYLTAQVVSHPQKMGVMNIVWPVTALFGTVISIWAYKRWGHAGHEKGKGETPFAVMVGKGAAHCGSGCTLGDIAAESLVIVAPGVLAYFGLGSIFNEAVFARWVLDFVFAFAIGIVFQYFAIAPMRDLSVGEGIWAALKADTLSLSAWQLGMYGFMAVAGFWLFRGVLGVSLEPTMPEFWFMMQIAMICGFATAYPVNWWLIRRGWKEKM